MQQATQPVSQHIAKKVLVDYSGGKRTWRKALRLEKIETQESGLEESDTEIVEFSDRELEQNIKKNSYYFWLALAVSVFTISLVVLNVTNIETITLEHVVQFLPVALGPVAILAFVVRRHFEMKAEMRNRQGNITPG